eukprot:c11731_g1_i1 orf=606-1184(-)
MTSSSRLMMKQRGVILMLCIIWRSGASGAGASRVYRVGGDKGWVVGVVNYTQWASNYTFYVGDFLVFNYLQEFHNVLEVTKESYASCGGSNPIAEYKDGKTSFYLKEAKPYYFICGERMHCPLGQRLEVLALENPQHAPSPSPHLFLPSYPSLSPSPYAHSSSVDPTFCAFSYLKILLLLLMLLFYGCHVHF